jgi:hypothetical protein
MEVDYISVVMRLGMSPLGSFKQVGKVFAVLGCFIMVVAAGHSVSEKQINK